MTLQEMVKGIEGTSGNRYQATQYQILRMLDLAQKAAFNHDCRAFEKRATLPIVNNTVFLGRINLTSLEIGNMADASSNSKLTNAASSFIGIDAIRQGHSLLSLDGHLYYVISRPASNVILWIERKIEYLEFPKNCRAIKEVFARAIEVDNFARRITSDVPRDTLNISYYIQPENLTYYSEDENGTLTFAKEDEAKVIVPDEWRWTALVQPAIAMLDTTQYGDKSQQAYLETYFREFWAAMDSRRNDRETLSSVGAW